jgi:hypothetical protein
MVTLVLLYCRVCSMCRVRSVDASVKVNHNIDGAGIQISLCSPPTRQRTYATRISAAIRMITVRQVSSYPIADAKSDRLPIHSRTSPCLRLPCSLNTASKSATNHQHLISLSEPFNLNSPAMTSNLSVNNPTRCSISK